MGQIKAIVFVAAMLTGMGMFELAATARQYRAPTEQRFY